MLHLNSGASEVHGAAAGVAGETALGEGGGEDDRAKGARKEGLRAPCAAEVVVIHVGEGLRGVRRGTAASFSAAGWFLRYTSVIYFCVHG